METIMTFLARPVPSWALCLSLLALTATLPLLLLALSAATKALSRLRDARHRIAYLKDEHAAEAEDLDDALHVFCEIIGTAVPRRNGRMLDPNGRDRQDETGYPEDRTPEEAAALSAHDAARANAESLRRLLCAIRARCDGDCPAVRRNTVAMMHNAGLLALRAPETETEGAPE